MKLLLVRHGQTQANLDGVVSSWAPGEPLTEAGHAQAVELAERFSDASVDSVFASTLLRAQQTASHLADARRLPVVVVDGLQEVEAGEAEDDGTYMDTIARWANGDLGATHPGAFDGQHFLDRFDAAVDRVAAAVGVAGTAAVVTHHVCIAVWASVRGHNVTPEFALTHAIDNAGVVELHGGPDGGWRVVSWCGGAVA